MKTVARIALYCVLAVLGLVALSLGALQLGPVRGVVRDELLSLVRSELPGTLVIEDLRLPTLRRIELDGVSLRDPDGEEVAGLDSAALDIDPIALISGKVQIVKARLDGVRLDLGDVAEGRGGLFAALPPSAPPDAPRSEAAGSPVRIRAGDLCASITRVEARLDGGRRVAIEDGSLCGELAISTGESLRVELAELRGSLLADGQLAARLVASSELLAKTDAATDTTSAALSGVFEMEADAMRIDARLGIRGLSRRALALAGWQDAQLPSPLDVDVRAKGSLDDLAVNATVGDPDRKQAPLAARIDIRLAHFGTAPASAASAQAPVIEGELRDGSYRGTALPRIELRLRLPKGGAVVLDDLRATQGGARLRGSGRLGADGTLRADARLSAPELSELPPISRLLPELAGKLEAELRLERSGDDLRLDVDARLEGATLGELRAGALSADARLSGELAAPRVRARIDGRALVVDGQTIESARLTIEGGPRRYDLAAHAERDRLWLEGWAAVDDGVWRGAGRAGLRTPRGKIAARIRGLRIAPEREVAIAGLDLRYHDATATVSGSFSLGKEPSDLTFRGEIPDLATESKRLAGRSIPGRVSFEGRARGTIDAPKLALSLRYSDGIAFGDGPLDAKVDVDVDVARRRIALDVEAEGGERATLDLSLRSRLSRASPTLESLERGEHEVELEVAAVSLRELIQALPEGSVPVAAEGEVSLSLRARGTLADPVAQLDLRVRAALEGDDAPLAFALGSEYTDSTLTLTLTADDTRGRLLTTRVETEVQRDLLARGVEHADEILQQSRWDLTIDLASRRLWNLPGIRVAGREQLLMPWRVALDGHIAHEPGAEPKGELHGRAEWLPPAAVSDEDADCSSRARFTADFSAKMREGRLTTEVLASSRGRQVASLGTSSHAPLGRWLSAEPMDVGPAQLAARFDDLRVERLPIVCEHASGRVSGTLRGEELFDDRADLELDVSLERFQFEDGPRFDADVTARSKGHMLALDASLRERGGRASVSGALPVSFRVDHPALCVHDRQPLDLRVAFSKVDVQPLLSAIPGFANPSGTIDGTLAISGSLDAPEASGALELSGVSLTLPELGQRFSRIDATAFLDGRTLRIPKARFEDRGGYAKIAAELTFESAKSWHGALDLKSDDFPLRNRGVYLGETDARVHVEARANAGRIEVLAKVKEMSVDLTSRDFGAVQSLEPNPDIVFAHAREEDLEREAQGEPLAVAIEIRTESPVWVRRDDFALQIEAKLSVEPRPDKPASVSGEVRVRRGFVSLFGQSFDVERGRVTFTGGDAVDPLLEITATQDNPGGSTTRVEVSGFVHAPELAFFVDDEAVTAGDALAALTGRGDDATQQEASAQEQLTSVAMGMTMGLLSLGARREFGEWVPMLAIKQTSEGARVSAGIEADRIIPKFLRGFVRGAYVEGIVSAGDSEAGSEGESSSVSANGASGGVLLELLLPKDLVWTGQYGPGQRWSIDLDWRP